MQAVSQQQLRIEELLITFQRAMGYNDAELAAWLEMPEDRLDLLRQQPMPRRAASALAPDCIAIAREAGCDAWSLSLLVLWAQGRR